MRSTSARSSETVGARWRGAARQHRSPAARTSATLGLRHPGTERRARGSHRARPSVRAKSAGNAASQRRSVLRSPRVEVGEPVVGDQGLRRGEVAGDHGVLEGQIDVALLPPTSAAADRWISRHRSRVGLLQLGRQPPREQRVHAEPLVALVEREQQELLAVHAPQAGEPSAGRPRISSHISPVKRSRHAASQRNCRSLRRQLPGPLRSEVVDDVGGVTDVVGRQPRRRSPSPRKARARPAGSRRPTLRSGRTAG